MKRTWKGLLVLVAALMAVAGWQTPASANTELVPGSRLIFPYIDVSSGRETFVFLTNVSGDETDGVHLEFYNQVCNKTNKRVILTEKDLDVVVVSEAIGTGHFVPGSGVAQQAIQGIGWLDVDVREDTGRDGCSSSSLFGCPSIEFNGLMGMAVIIDVPNDFAMAYPAAASQGSSSNGISSTIVERVGEFAADWNGTYETYPSTIMVPGFFAEDPCSTPFPAALNAFISVVGPADAWRKEAPGADLTLAGVAPSILVSLDGTAYDGDENGESIQADAHMVNGRLCTVFLDRIGTRNEYVLPSSLSDYPTYDVTNGSINPVGWLELSNFVTVPTGNTGATTPAGVPVNPNFNDLNEFDDSLRYRGIVGLLFEIQANDPITIGDPNTSGSVKTADAIRFWADPATQIDWPCFGTEGNGGISPPTILSGAPFAPTCDDEGGAGGFSGVNPSWLGDHTLALFGNDGSTRGQASP